MSFGAKTEAMKGEAFSYFKKLEFTEDPPVSTIKSSVWKYMLLNSGVKVLLTSIA